jgi:hypothetical protein
MGVEDHEAIMMCAEDEVESWYMSGLFDFKCNDSHVCGLRVDLRSLRSDSFYTSDGHSFALLHRPGVILPFLTSCLHSIRLDCMIPPCI